MMHRLHAAALAVLLALTPTAEASQNSLFSPTTGTVSGLQTDEQLQQRDRQRKYLQQRRFSAHEPDCRARHRWTIAGLTPRSRPID
jgi:hypothetical protein